MLSSGVWTFSHFSYKTDYDALKNQSLYNCIIKSNLTIKISGTPGGYFCYESNFGSDFDAVIAQLMM